MLHVLLTILKILGILILVILGIILTIILLVLLVPIRYRADVSFDGKPKGEICVSWLLRLVRVQVRYDEKVYARVKVLLFRLIDKAVCPSEPDESADETEEAFDEFMEEDFPPEPPKKISIAEKTAKPETTKTNGSDGEPVRATSYESCSSGEGEKPPKPAQKDPANRSSSENSDQDLKEESKVSIIEKIKNLIDKLMKKVSDLVRNISVKKQVISDKYAYIMGILKNPENQNTFKLILRQIGRLIKHVIPVKIRGRLKFGFDDPYTTGQILTYISPFYGLYAKTFSIEPVFDEKITEGEVHLKGRIRLGSLLWIVIRIFLDKNFRRLLKGFMAKKK